MELSHIESRLCQPAQSAHTHKSATQCFHYAVPKAGSVVTQDNQCFVGRFLPSDQPQPRTSHLFIPEFAICLVGMWGMWPFFFIVTNTVLCWMRKCMARDSFSLRCSILLPSDCHLGMQDCRHMAHISYWVWRMFEVVQFFQFGIIISRFLLVQGLSFIWCLFKVERYCICMSC